MHAARNQSGKVRHVHNVERADFVRDLPHPRKVDHPRVRASAAHDHLRLLAHRKLFQRVVINNLCILTHLVAHDAVQLPRKIQLVPMRQMPAMRQVQPKQRIPRLQDAHIRRRIRLRARVRLHIRMLRAEQLLRAIPRQRLHHIGILAAAVVALAGIAFGIFVGKDRSRRFQHSA